MLDATKAASPSGHVHAPPILVNEIFGPTIQGEGPSAGMPCMFLRLAHCNLSCNYCDTPYTWNWLGTKFSHPEKYAYAKEIHPMTAGEVLAKLDHSDPKRWGINCLVVSGGEPMLQQRRLAQVVNMLQAISWWIEIETNGTIMPQPDFVSLIRQINCSPKLSNSDDPLERRIKPKVLNALSAIDKTIFKFVVGSESDVDEVVQLVEQFGMKQVWLMPQARTKDELERSYPLVCKLAERHGFHASSRKHIEQWGNKRGV